MITTHPQMLDEILSKVNDSEDVVLALQTSYSTPYIKNYMELAVNDVWLTVDIDTIEATQYNYHRSMAGTFLLNRHTWNTFNSVIMRIDIPDKTKNVQIKSLFEMLFEGERNIARSILVKDFTPLYPNITFDVIVKSLV